LCLVGHAKSSNEQKEGKTMITEVRITGLEMFGDLRVVPIKHSKPLAYQIDELVTPDGMYITWDHIFTTPESALKYICT
jgi:hypothetical protein